MRINPEFQDLPDDDELEGGDKLKYIDSYNDFPEEVSEMVDEQTSRIMELIKESNHKDPLFQHLGFQNVQIQSLQRSVIALQKGMMALTLAMEIHTKEDE